MQSKLLKIFIQISKITFYAMVLQFSFFAFAASEELKAQRKKLHEIKVEMTTGHKDFFALVSEIEQSSGFTFAYTKKEVANKSVFISRQNWYLQELLTEVSSQTKLVFKRVNEIITAKKIKATKNVSTVTDIVEPKFAVTGKVTDENGEGLPGVSVLAKGTAVGTITDTDGNYILEVPDNATVLVFSYVGYLSEEVAIGGKNVVDIQLVPDIERLEEIVVIGYGTVQKSDLTGAISSVKAEDLPISANTSINQALAARAPGLVITQNSNQPGGAANILIRGRASVGAGNAPLFVVDGFPLGGGSIEPGGGIRYGEDGARDPLNSINPNDIESIEILKDASATSIYGARAANGVILITTKRGKSGAPKVDYNGNFTFQRTAEWLDLLNAQEYMTVRNELLVENGQAPAYTEAEINSAGEGTNWFDEITRPAHLTQHNVSVNGGNEYTKYLFSVNYFDQQGLVKNSDLTRYTVRLNLDQKISDRISWGVSLTGSQIDNVNAPLGGSFNENTPPLRGAIDFNPTIPVRDENGDYALHEILPAVLPNPVSLFEITDNTRTNRLFAQGFIDVEIIEGLTGTLKVGLDRRSGKRDSFLPRTLIFGAPLNGQGSKAFNENSDHLFEGVLSYDKSFGESHSIKAVAGYSYQEFNWEGFNASNNDFISDGLLYNDLGAGNGTRGLGSFKGFTDLASYFGRVNYSYEDRYLVTVSLRADGSPRFGANNKFGYFPSVALGWRVINENFFPEQNVVSDLKLRVSYGQTGNAAIGGNALAIFTADVNYLFGSQGNEQRSTGVRQSQLANPELKWETTTEINLGLDFGLFDGRITGTVEYFDKEVSDLLSSRQLKTYLPISRVADNIGTTTSNGIEVSLSTINQFGELTWSMDLNLATYRDRWKERDPDNILPPYLKEQDFIRPIYGFQIDGVIQEGDQIPAHMPGATAGMVRLVDWNGLDADGNLTGEPDGSLTPADFVFYGTEDPGFTYGIGTRFEYKGFDLYAFFQGMGDRLRYNSPRDFYTSQLGRMRDEGRNMLREVLDRWTPQNPDGLGLRYEGAPNTTLGLYLEDAGFLRLRNLTFGYTFPRSIIGDYIFKNVKLYFDAQNLFVITDYSGIDPESDSIGAYPNQRSYTVGVNLSF